MIRKATAQDIDQVEAIYEHIHEKEQRGLSRIGWLPGIYPIRDTALAALGRDDLFVWEEDGQILASAVINCLQVDVYALGDWYYPAEDNQVLVLHTLTVEPDAENKGIGGGFISYYEEMAAREGCRAVRIDTNAKNERARRLYKKLGYREAGIVPCVFNGIPDVQLVLLEKKIFPQA